MSQSDEFQARLRTLEELRGAGIDPYPPRAHPTHTAAQVRALLQEREGDHVTVAGRIVGGLRPMGKLAFVHIQDGSMPQAAEASASERRLNMPQAAEASAS